MKKTVAQALEEVRALARPYAPKDRLASEALIAERRAEADAAVASPEKDRNEVRIRRVGGKLRS